MMAEDKARQVEPESVKYVRRHLGNDVVDGLLSDLELKEVPGVSLDYTVRFREYAARIRNVDKPPQTDSEGWVRFYRGKDTVALFHRDQVISILLVGSEAAELPAAAG